MKNKQKSEKEILSLRDGYDRTFMGFNKDKQKLSPLEQASTITVFEELQVSRDNVQRHLNDRWLEIQRLKESDPAAAKKAEEAAAAKAREESELTAKNEKIRIIAKKEEEERLAKEKAAIKAEEEKALATEKQSTTGSKYGVQIFALSKYTEQKVRDFCKRNNLEYSKINTLVVKGITRVRYGSVNSKEEAEKLKKELLTRPQINGGYVVKL